MFRKSNKQRRAEIKAARLKRALASQGRFVHGAGAAHTAVAADHSKLAHVCGCHLLPQFYLDRPFTCRDCGVQEVWTAMQQKWWYEVAKGRLDSIAIRCRPCRKTERARKAAARLVHFAGLANKLNA